MGSIPQNVNQLVYTAGTHYGDTAYLFNINPPRFTGYTKDKQVFHVLDNSNLVYNSFTKNEIDRLLRSNYFQIDRMPFEPGGSENIVDYDQQPSGDGNNTVLYIGLGIAAVIGLAIWGSKN